MTREEVKNAGSKHAQDMYCSGDNPTPRYRIAQIHASKDGFVAGAEWRINSVWHPNTEIPNRSIDSSYCGEACLIETIDGGLNFGIIYYRYGYNGKMCYTVTCLDITYTMDQIKRWAYVKDLIPNKED